MKINVFDVPAGELIAEIGQGFGQNPELKAPAFTNYVKTGTHTERQPEHKNWYFVRMASILYRVYKDGPVGTGSLRSYYGGRKNRGVKPHQFRKASGKIIRSCLQSLEKQGLIKKAKKGREITAKGQKLLVTTANAIYPELGKRFEQRQADKAERTIARLGREKEFKASGSILRKPEAHPITKGKEKKKEDKSDHAKGKKEGKK